MDVRFSCIDCPTQALRSRHRMLSLNDDGASTIHATVSYFIPHWQVGGRGEMMMDGPPRRFMCARRGPNPRVQGQSGGYVRRLFNSGSAKAMSIQLRPKPEHAKSDFSFFFLFPFPRSYGSSATESQQKADSRQTRCLGAPLHEPSANFEAQFSLAYGGAASEPSSKPSSLLDELPANCSPAAPLHCSALHCKSQLRSAAPLDFLQPAFHSPQPRHLPFSLTHTHTHTRRPLHRRIRLPCCLAACLPARTCQPAPACPYLPRSETAVQRAGPVLCLCLCLCLCRRLGRPSAAPPVFGGSPSCIAIAENILTTSTRRRLNPAQSQAPSSPSSAAHCLHSLASFLLVVGHSLLLPLGLFPSLSFCLSPCLSLSLSSCTSEPHIVGTTLVVRIVACTASHPNDNAIPRATPFLATFGESHRNHARTYTSSSTVLLPSSRAALSSASTWIPRHSRHGTTAALRSTTRAKSAQTTHQRAALAALTHVPARRSRCAQSHHSNLAAGLNRPPRHFRSAPPSVAH